MEQKYDVVIIGKGVAAYYAAICLQRYNKKILMVGTSYAVGNREKWRKIELLKEKEKLLFRLHLDQILVADEVVGIEQKKTGFKVIGQRDCYYGEKVVLATGRRNRYWQSEFFDLCRKLYYGEDEETLRLKEKNIVIYSTFNTDKVEELYR